MAHLVCQLATKSEVRGSNPSPGQTNLSFAPPGPPSTRSLENRRKRRRASKEFKCVNRHPNSIAKSSVI
ncbi:hypothetical protein PoB_002695800 [Plakobranchus ocellatus]|uniref:Uncharacterized protein n=1 Tax=Plakobranchus ocellatus TaxID=259542 RepID=A0AAV4A147_9GAST|nr:hypothetical protein PoB_002695800 [Plakobranchus ocellatus]